MNFMKEFTRDGETRPVQDHGEIAVTYMSSGAFIFDVVTLVPLAWALQGIHLGKVTYYLKVIRFLKALEIFDVSQMNRNAKEFAKKRIMKKIKSDPLIAEDTENDHNSIEALMIFSYLLKTTKLIIIIVNISYFLGMFWITFCDLTSEFRY